MSNDDSYLNAAMAAAATRTYRIASQFGLTPADREDLQQELLLDLLEHRAKFDPAKGSANTFTGVVSKNRATELLDRFIKDRQRLTFFGTEAANDDSMSDDDADVTAMRLARSSAANDDDLFEESATLHCLTVALAYMTGEQAMLFQLLETHQDLPSAARAARAAGMSSATFYRRVDELRMHLRMFGIKAA